MSLLPPPVCAADEDRFRRVAGARQAAGHHGVFAVAQRGGIQAQHQMPRLQLRSCQVGAVESVTYSCPTYRCGLASSIARDFVQRNACPADRHPSRAGKACLIDQPIEPVHDRCRARRLVRTTRWPPAAGAAPRPAAGGTVRAETAAAPASRPRPTPMALASTTLPARAACNRPGTPSKRIVAQLQRIAEVAADAAEDHIDRQQAAQRLQEHALIADGQVARLRPG